MVDPVLVRTVTAADLPAVARLAAGLVQYHRALDPLRSFLVQAPAGSGKTELLIQRYLTLLARVDQPEAVVAITFTKKAAGEMRQRVVKALREGAGPRPKKAHEALTWELARDVRERSDALRWDLYRNPSRLRIRTIDSLCASLTRQMPLLFRSGRAAEYCERPAPIVCRGGAPHHRDAGIGAMVRTGRGAAGAPR